MSLVSVNRKQLSPREKEEEVSSSNDEALEMETKKEKRTIWGNPKKYVIFLL